MYKSPCRGGEIGRHAALRSLWSKIRAGSTPVPGTKQDEMRIDYRHFSAIAKGVASAAPFFI